MNNGYYQGQGNFPPEDYNTSQWQNQQQTPMDYNNIASQYQDQQGFPSPYYNQQLYQQFNGYPQHPNQSAFAPQMIPNQFQNVSQQPAQYYNNQYPVQYPPQPIQYPQQNISQQNVSQLQMYTPQAPYIPQNQSPAPSAPNPMPYQNQPANPSQFQYQDQSSYPAQPQYQQKPVTSYRNHIPHQVPQPQPHYQQTPTQPSPRPVNQPVIQPVSQPVSNLSHPHITTEKSRKRKTEDYSTPLKHTINSSQQPTPLLMSTPPSAVFSEQGFKFDDEVPKQYDTPSSKLKRQRLPPTDISKQDMCSPDELSGVISTETMKVQQLLDLAEEYNHFATTHWSQVNTRKNLQEYYTLIQLSISCYQKILGYKKKSVKLDTKIKCNRAIADLLVWNCNSSEDNPSDSPEYYYDQAILLCGDNAQYKYEKSVCEVSIVNCLIQKKKFKQALNLINEKIEEWGIENSSVLIYFKFQIFLLTDPSKALPFLRNYLSSLPERNATDNTANDIEGIEYLRLNEYIISVYRGEQPLSEIPSRQYNMSIQLLGRFALILAGKFMKGLRTSYDDEDCFKSIAFLINSLDSTASDSLSVKFKISGGSSMILSTQSLDQGEFSIFMCLFYAISLLNSSFEKRKSLKLLNKTLELIDSALRKINVYQKSFKFYENKVTKLKYMRSLTIFYKIIENSIMEPIDPKLFKEFQLSVKDVPVYAIESHQFKELYIKGLKAQMNGKLMNAKNHYKKLLLEQESDSNKRTVHQDGAGIGNDYYAGKNLHSELYIISCLNVLLIIESSLHYYKRASKEWEVTKLTNERNEILDKIDRVINTKRSASSESYLIKTTISFIHLLYNYENLTTLEINEKVSNILQNFDQLRKFPLLCAILLYIKSNSLNSNSDQKQKSSQVSFNLAKLGFSPIIRYLSGELNGNNATVARNLQQAEIQKQKLQKIRKSMGTKYDSLYDENGFD